MNDPLAAFAGVAEAELRGIIEAEAAKRNLAEYLRQLWGATYPNRQLKWGWHIDCIAEHLEAVTLGQITRLVINIPPRTLKSTLVSVAWPSWEWIEKPSLQYIAASAIQSVVVRDAKAHMDVCRSPWYQEAFRPDWQFDPGQSAKTNFTNTAGGGRISVTTGQRITGSGGDRVIVDDPIDASDAFSDKAQLVEHVRYFDQSLQTRLNDDIESAIVVVMQRLNERELSGHLIKQGGWEHVCLPAEWDGRRRFSFLGEYDPRKIKGELLFPARLPAAVLRKKRKALGARGYAGQYLQLPAPEGGTMVKESWIQYWIKNTLPEFESVISSWDCAFKKSNDTDFVVGQAWGVLGSLRYLISQVRARMSFTETLRAIREMQRRELCSATIVEVKANGRKVIKTLHREIPNLEPFDPQGSSKQERLNACLPTFEASQIFIPHPEHQPWVRESYLPELLGFPQGARDDQVDATSQALIWISEHGPVLPQVYTL